MRKLLFDSKIKDGIWLLAVLTVVIITSLNLDDVQGALRPGKIRVTVYVPSYEVPSDGPALKPGDPVKLYKKVVGRILSADFFVARVKKPLETDAAAPSGPAPSSPPTTNAVAPSRPDLVSGLKLTVELFKAQYPQILSLVTPDSQVRVESATLGESSLLLVLAPTGDPIKSGDIINFPRNHVSFYDPKAPQTKYGVELLSEAEIVAVRREIDKLSPRKGIAEPPKKNPSDDF